MNDEKIFQRLYKSGEVTLPTFAYLADEPIGELKGNLDRLVSSGELIYQNGRYNLSEQFRQGMEGIDESGILDKEVRTGDIHDVDNDGTNQSQEIETKIEASHQEEGDIISGAINELPETIEKQTTEQVIPKKTKARKVSVSIKQNGATKTHGTVGLFETIVLKFAHVLQYFAFLITSLADLGLAMFFYWSLGYDNASKLILATWGIVQTGSKIWAWSYNRRVIAVWCAVLSVVASVSIFLSVIELQASQAEKSNSTVTIDDTVNSRIASLEADRQAQVNRRDKLPSDYSTAIKSANLDIAKIDEQLNKLLDKKLAPKDIANNDQVETIKLSAWSIFRQLTDIKWNDAARMFALVFILALSILLEMVIYATVPRNKGELK